MKKFKLFNYDPPKKGVEKTDERASVQTDFLGFFIMYGRKFWNISNLNLLMAAYILIVALGVWQLSSNYVLFYIFLGICTLAFGIINLSTTYVTRGYVRGDPVYILSDTKYAVKNNWKQGILLGIVDVLVIALLIFDIFFWSGMDMSKLNNAEQYNQTSIEQTVDPSNGTDEVLSFETNGEVSSDASSSGKSTDFLSGVCFYSSIFLLIIYMFMRNYMYLLLVTFKLSIYKTLKNSFIFAFLGIKRNILAAIGIFAVCFLNIYIFVYVPMVGIMLPLIITLSTCTFIGSYAAYPVIKKYMITPYYNDDEEFETYDKVFVDRG